MNIIINKFEEKHYYFWKKTINLIWMVKLNFIIKKKFKKNIITIKEKP